MNAIQLCDRLCCTGCSACHDACPVACIEMKPDAEGFLHPHIDHSRCIACGRCMKTCPVLSPPALERAAEPDAYAGWLLERETLEKSASGGAFTALARSVFARGGVVFGAVMDASLRVRHTMACDEQELAPMRGSKYVQSFAAGAYKQAAERLAAGCEVLFSGTPCQIAGLYGYLGPRAATPLLTTCEVVCHGVPSPAAFGTYLQKIGAEDATGFEFRNTKTWSFDTRVIRKGSARILFGRRDYYMKAFLRALNYRESCYRCPFARLPRTADITIADFWGIGRRTPFAINPRGVSLVLLNSAAGRAWKERLAAAMRLERRWLEEAVAENRNIVAPTSRPAARDTIYAEMHLPLRELTRRYGLAPTLRNYAGYLRRRLRSVYLSIRK